MNLRDKVVVVTGASRGLGAAFAEVLASEGAKLFICSNDKEGIEKECNKIKENDGQCESSVVNVTNKEQVAKFVSEVLEKNNGIDILINNAGTIHPMHPVEEITDDEYEKCMKTNIDSVFYFLRAVLPSMKEKDSGTIVNISSGAGKRAHPNLSIYCASKFAVEGLTQSLAKELVDTGVKCFAVCPGGVNTKMRAFLFGDEESANQQSPETVANILKDILLEKTEVPNGADVHIRDGKITDIENTV
jgi:NAD(P)-dependent dehydrogenase (short-subunit alcohol dehydrogenase family)